MTFLDYSISCMVSKIWPIRSRKKQKQKKLVLQTDGPAKWGRLVRTFFFFLIFFFFLSGGKNYSPKNNKISQKSDVFWRKKLDKDFQSFPKKI